LLGRAPAAVAVLATAAVLIAPAAAPAGATAQPMTTAPTTLVDAGAYGPGYSPAVTEDSYYPDQGDPGIDVLDYNLDLTWMPNPRSLQGIATLRIRAITTAAQLQLDLAGQLQVSAVTVGGVAAGFTHDGKELVVATPVVADNVYDVQVSYAGTPQPVRAPTSEQQMPSLGWHTNSDGQVWAMQEPYGAFTWYPANDQPSDKAMYQVRLNVPDKWVGLTNGTMSSRRHIGTRTVTTFSNRDPLPTYQMTVAIGPYSRYQQTGPGGLPMTYWYPKGRTDLLAPLKGAPGAITWLQSKLGPYPFARVGVVVTPSESSAPTQTLITLGSKNYRYGNADVREQLVRQLAQAWYGGTVTPRDWSDLWMNEGMSTYLQALYSTARHYKSWSYWRSELTRNDGFYREIYGAPGAYRSNEFGQRNVGYGTALMLDRLRGVLGNKRFYSAMKAWPQQHRDTTATRGQYVGWVERRTGKELSSFFNAWLTSTHTPRS
jgi:aminopeptidase N